jgi:hypothetical protein
MTQQNKNWLKDNTFGLISVAMTVLTVLYYGVVKDNDDHNEIIALKSRMEKQEVQSKYLDDKKVDKEVFFMIQVGIAEIKADIREMRLDQKK